MTTCFRRNNQGDPNPIWTSKEKGNSRNNLEIYIESDLNLFVFLGLSSLIYEMK